ncbi:uncharacterized protein LOC110099912 isoform X1 [Dendrobium catenatum]|uniref:uncharacterized protein LOC110099912 isoform X1 n=1 Tax=Dendrobium catenatum TaxID=906689 RepID=UPI0009F1AA40|nr:uncharacterized protein LOC110099912 isoform X1 [Dendrobium catenatum]
MKFEELLMQREELNQKRLELEAEVAHLQEVLENEQKLNTVLHRVLHGSIVCHSCLSSSSSSVSSQIQILIGEIAKVEEEIIYLERKVDEIKLNLHQERKYKKECQQLQWEQKLQRQQRREEGSHGLIEQSPNMEIINQIPINERNTSLQLVAESKSLHYKKISDNEADENTDKFQQPYQIQGFRNEETYRGAPNKLSEQLIKILVSIFKKLIVPQAHLECEATTAPKLNISCIRSKSFMPKHLTSSRAPIIFQGTQIQDPYSILPDGDIGPYKKFIQLTRSTLDLNRIVLCLPAIEKLRFLIHKLTVVELHFLSYKQRLPFWINIYNASIMNAFLQHGWPTSPGKLLKLLNKAAFNVGGIVLNALAIEHFILRCSSDVKNGTVDEKEAELRHTYGLGYPEPNITFALCRGSFSSPALRVYTADNVVNELERAKVEFLEASICITSKKKIVIPKLLEWHMLDFADDIESLIEWIYSQLPRSTSLKRSMMEWLSSDNRTSLSKMVEIKPYSAEFRYLLSNY